MSYCTESIRALFRDALQQKICEQCSKDCVRYMLSVDGLDQRRHQYVAPIGIRLRKDTKYPIVSTSDATVLGTYLHKALNFSAIPGMVAYIVANSPYVFMTKKGSEEVQAARDAATRRIRAATKSFYAILDDGALSAIEKNKAFAREMKLGGALEVLKQEYKIHLQVHPAYITTLLRVLLADEAFLEIMGTVKVLSDHKRVETDEALPMVVIYPEQGHEQAQKMISVVYDAIDGAFSSADVAKMAWDATPRFNKKYSEVVYYANGGGDVKANYQHFLQTTSQRNVLYLKDFTRFKGTKLLN